MNLSERLRRVREEIDAACLDAGRRTDSVCLIAVSKRFGADAIREAFAAGQVDFGENYAEELVGKAAVLTTDIRWHWIGHIQRRNVKKLDQTPVLVHTLSRLDVLEQFHKRYGKELPDFLVQVNIGREPQKSGIMPDQLEAFLDAVEQVAYDVTIRGLMVIPPRVDNVKAARSAFAQTRELGNRHQKRFFNQRVELSMGMSSDYALAISEGATMVRIGTKIFGDRPSSVRKEG